MLPSRRQGVRGDRGNTVSKRGVSKHESAKKTQFRLRLHDQNYLGGDELLVNPDFFPDVREGDMVRISVMENEDQNSEKLPDNFVLKVSSVKRLPAEISILSVVADIFKLSAQMIVEVEKVPKENALVESVELTLKDQYISSSEMWRLKLFLADSWLHIHKQLAMGLVKVRVKDLRTENESVNGGLVSTETTITFRSKSANLFWLVQISREMWEQAGDGRLHYELLYELIQKIAETWNEADVNHTLTVVFFARVFVGGTGRNVDDARDESKSDSRFFDVFKVVLDKVKSSDFSKDSASILRRIKHEFSVFPSTVNWAPTGGFHDESEKGAHSSEYGTLSSAMEGNTLEALNLTLNNWNDLKMDRAFPYTGTSIILMTAGNGVMKVDKLLAEITKRRLLDTGMVCETISLSSPPGHQVPILFLDEREFKLIETRSNNSEISSLPSGSKFPVEQAVRGVTGETHEQLGETVQEVAFQKFTVPDSWLRIRFCCKRFDDYALLQAPLEKPVVPFFDDGHAEDIRLNSQKEFRKHDDAIFVPPSPPNNEDRGMMEDDTNSSVEYGDEYYSPFRQEGDMTEYSRMRDLARSADQQNTSRLAGLPSRRTIASMRGKYDLGLTNRITHSSLSSKDSSLQRGLHMKTDWRGSPSPRALIDHLSGGGSTSGNEQLARFAATRILDAEFDDISVRVAPYNTHLYATDHEKAMIVEDRESSDSPLVLPEETLWKTFVDPSILPLTTTWTPDEHLLRVRGSEEYGYLLSTGKVSAEEEELVALVKELICQRMVMDYQVVTGISDETFLSPEGEQTQNKNAISHLSRVRATKSVYLTKGEQFHELIVEPESRGVRVIRRVRIDEAASKKQQYGYCLWSRAKNAFLARSTVFEYGPERVNWNKLDQILVDGLDVNLDLVSHEICRKASFVLLANRAAPGPLTGEPTQAERGGDGEIFSNFVKLFELMTKTSPEHVEIMRNGRKILLPWRHGYSAKEPLKFMVGMQPFRGLENEWIMLSCDSFFSLETCFHININWIACDGNVVSDYTQTFERRAKQLGFRMLSVPVFLFSKSLGAFENQLNHVVSPFQALVLHEFLLLHCNFLVNSASDNYVQYFHANGLVVVNITGSFLEVDRKENNRECTVTYTENTLPDFMEKDAVRIYRKITAFLDRTHSDEEVIAEAINLCVHKAISKF
ncbi:hypothetical protein NDN08_001138 [Rhodosorus marinus]|uniref:DEP domain-containing protein n=1 Tax=Rhodosorus marinus TaxID=101924 RepID=A0AAV8UPZ9_9RHOD|nr:hypothetical protein NDN08_001138 [Rhodosorus marinus]